MGACPAGERLAQPRLPPFIKSHPVMKPCSGSSKSIGVLSLMISRGVLVGVGQSLSLAVGADDSGAVADAASVI